ncbi:MAG TPA: N-acetylornithine carbamoyltransferase [Membranihabitans sp.]|nr:N-acetylornithine carbamoyltransferase [Membranihabitans sp.]
MKNFINTDHIDDILTLAREGLRLKTAEGKIQPGMGKVLTCLYLNPSLRTRLSTEIAARKLGMDCINLAADSAWKLETRTGVVMDGDAAEHIKEQAEVLSRYSDIIAIRAFPHLQDADEDYHDDFISRFARYCDTPILNLESGSLHPLQGLADLMTIEETKKQDRPKIVLTWAPHPRKLPQSVANSFSRTIQQAGYELTIACPQGMELADQYLGNARVVHDQDEALEGADFVYAKNWSSFHTYGQIMLNRSDWTVTKAKMDRTNNGRFMHCLPVRRNVVVADEVLDSPSSLVGEQAENRIYAAQIVLQKLLGS